MAIRDPSGPVIPIHLQDGPFQGQKLSRRNGSIKEHTVIHFDGFSYRLEWQPDVLKWYGYVITNGE